MGSFQQRLVELMRTHGVENAPQLARLLGYSGSERVRLVLNGTSKPSFGMLEDMARVLAPVNLHWLITGVGSPTLDADHISSAVTHVSVESLAEGLDQLRREVAALKDQKNARPAKGKKAS